MAEEMDLMKAENLVLNSDLQQAGLKDDKKVVNSVKRIVDAELDDL